MIRHLNFPAGSYKGYRLEEVEYRFSARYSLARSRENVAGPGVDADFAHLYPHNERSPRPAGIDGCQIEEHEDDEADRDRLSEVNCRTYREFANE